MDQDKFMEEVWNNKGDILKHYSKIHGNLKKDIEDDFVLGKPTEQEKKFLIKMSGLSNFARHIYEKIAEQAIVLSEQDHIHDNYREQLIIETREIREKITDQVFYNHMLKSKMIVIMARNDETNFLLKIAGGVNLQQENENYTTEKENDTIKSFLSKLKPERKDIGD